MAGCARVVELFISTARRTRMRLEVASIHDPRSSCGTSPECRRRRCRRPSSRSAGTPLLSAAPWRRPPPLRMEHRLANTAPTTRRSCFSALHFLESAKTCEARHARGAFQASRPWRYLRSGHPGSIEQLTRCRCVFGRTLICQQQRECIHLSGMERGDIVHGRSAHASGRYNSRFGGPLSQSPGSMRDYARAWSTLRMGRRCPLWSRCAWQPLAIE